MPFSHHSHSGQFCLHAIGDLEDMIKAAIRKKMDTLVLTEHVPRDQEIDLYPEEVVAGITIRDLFKTFDAYYAEARRLQAVYSSSISILVGMETDWIRPSSLQIIEDLLKRHPLDTLVGSVHHVHGVPIDFDRDKYQQARRISGGTDEKLFADYYDAQLEMLKAVKPPIVGHFDVIRLWSDAPNTSKKDHNQVWEKIRRNLRFVSSYGGMLEINTAAIRKGMREPYPDGEICQVCRPRLCGDEVDTRKEFLKLKGRFVLSDDSHNISQVGFGYESIMAFTEKIGIEGLAILQKGSTTNDARFPGVCALSLSVADLKDHTFFKGL
ncbi:histidinolphosphatase [Lambiella insularis]|nr:histidinolphosphatase [Lambiella insularis]